MPVKSAERTIRILEAFASACEPLALSELARRISIPVSACHGLVRTLEARGYLYALGPRKGYYPTLRWLEKARAIAAHDPLLERVTPLLEGLAASTGETVVLGKRLALMVVYLNVIESRHSIRYSARIGDLKPLYSSSIGKALLGAMPADVRDATLHRIKLARITPTTITRRSALEKDLAAALARGWAMTRGENVPDVHAIAAPIRIAGETYAIAVAGPAQRIDANLQAHVRQLIKTCQAMEDST